MKNCYASRCPTLLEALVLVVSVVLPAMVLIGYAQHLLSWPVSLIPAAPLAILFALFVLGFACRRGVRAELPALVTGLLSVALVTGYVIWLAWPSLFPVSTSTDAVHHFQLTDYIFENHALPRSNADAANLGEMVGYPFAATLVVALAAWLTGLMPLQLMHPLGAGFLGMSCLFVYAATVELVPWQRWRPVAGVLAIAMLFVPRHYIAGQLTEFFFYTQVFGQVWLLAILYWLIRLRNSGWSFYLVPLILSGAGLILSYPTWILACSLAIGAVLLLESDRAKGLKFSAIVFGPWCLLLLVFLQDRWQLGVNVIRNEGTTLGPGRELGVFFVLLALVGSVLSLRDRRRWPLAALTLFLSIQMAATYIAASLGYTSYYSANKMTYELIYPMAILAVTAIADMVNALAITRMGHGPMAAAPLALLLAATFMPRMGRVDVHPLPPAFSPDDYRAALWLARNAPNQRLAYLTTTRIVPYWVEAGVLKRPRGGNDGADLLLARPPLSFQSWVTDAGQSEAAFLGDAAGVDLSRVRVAFRAGSVAVIAGRGVQQ